MTSATLISLALAAGLGALAFGLARLVPLWEAFSAIGQTGRKAGRVLGNARLSDHWKEKAARLYAVRMLSDTGRSLAFLMFVLAPVFALAWLIDIVALDGMIERLMTVPGLIAATLGAALAGLVAGRGGAKADGGASAYSPTEKLLHRLALGSRAIAEVSFDIDQSMTRASRRDVSGEAHVFVVGLARAGTTALMRQIHDSGAFRSLQYDDMPFVLAPNLWRKLRGQGGGKGGEAPRERAHGDGLLVTSESPESLDEVFWRIFDGEAYIGPDALRPHAPDAELRAKFRDYVAAILAAAPGRRYLAKNNNNLLRLPALAETFPKAHILVVLRDPMDHAASLWRQHRNFADQATADPFVADYMGWLAHHEFGADHRPFAPEAARDATPDQPVYWLRQWIAVYERLLETMPAQAEVICYESLCDDPAVWRAIAGHIGIEEGAPAFRRPSHPPAQIEAGADELARAREIYEALRARSLGAALPARAAC